MHHEELVTPWTKSSYSNSGANCVEVARTFWGTVAVRDSKHPCGPELRFTPGEWKAFVSGVKLGEFE